MVFPFVNVGIDHSLYEVMKMVDEVGRVILRFGIGGRFNHQVFLQLELICKAPPLYVNTSEFRLFNMLDYCNQFK